MTHGDYAKMIQHRSTASATPEDMRRAFPKDHKPNWLPIEDFVGYRKPKEAPYVHPPVVDRHRAVIPIKPKPIEGKEYRCSGSGWRIIPYTGNLLRLIVTSPDVAERIENSNLAWLTSENDTLGVDFDCRYLFHAASYKLIRSIIRGKIFTAPIIRFLSYADVRNIGGTTLCCNYREHDWHHYESVLARFKGNRRVEIHTRDQGLCLYFSARYLPEFVDIWEGRIEKKKTDPKPKPTGPVQRRPRISENTKRAVRRLHSEGQTQKAIAEKLKLNKSTVSRLCSSIRKTVNGG